MKTFFECKFFCRSEKNSNKKVIKKTFNNYPAALDFARQQIVKIKPTGYFKHINNKKRADHNKGGKTAVALRNFFSDPDYDIGDFKSTYTDYNEYDYVSWDVSKDNIECVYSYDSGFLWFRYITNPGNHGNFSRGEHFCRAEREIREIESNYDWRIIEDNYIDRKLYVGFFCEDLTSELLDPDSCGFFELFIDEIEKYDTKWYPIMVHKLIDEKPLSVREIQKEMEQRYGVSISDNTIKSYILMFKELGYDVVRKKDTKTISVRGALVIDDDDWFAHWEPNHQQQIQRYVYSIRHKKTKE